MTKNYHLDPGYVTIPEANKIVLRILGVANKDDKSHYNKILNGAKKGLYGGKKHGSRMYQVRREDIIQYAEELLQVEKINLFDFDLETNAKEIEKLSKLPDIDQNTATKLYVYLKTLKFHEIITQEAFHDAEKKIILRMNMGKLTHQT
ncbi:hypothetical protein [Neobacillus sp. LXY-4]|uniref:hypothetical protein n=1 Tax=Neobacillus sp. LXY-4 TaxID=3379826 RepID=UPI003EDFFB96